MVNLNKLFPRLSIRSKLATAFVIASVIPLVAISTVGIVETLRAIRQGARSSLDYELRLAENNVGRILGGAERHVQYLAEEVLVPLTQGTSDHRTFAEMSRTVSDFLKTEPSLFRVRVFDSEGVEQYRGDRTGLRRTTPNGGEGNGMLYAWHAQSMSLGDKKLIPIEVTREADGQAPTPAVAIVLPIVSADERVVGAVVGEAYASVLFGEIEGQRDQLQGVTGLVDPEGRFLYHSEHKRYWNTLLATEGPDNLAVDFRPAEVTELLSGRSGTFMTAGRIVSFRPLDLGDTGLPPLTLYRSIPLAQLSAPVQRFLWYVGSAGAIVVALVVVAAVVGANQMTKPIIRMRDAAWRLARGEGDVHVEAATNDEIEDLAKDFSAVARLLSEHRTNLETMIADRTRALATTHAELADVLRHSADAIIVVDIQGEIRLWNRAAETLFGYAADEAKGRRAVDLIGPRGAGADREIAFAEREMNRSGALVGMRTTRVHRDGSMIPVSITQTSMVDAEGRRLGSSLIIRDGRAEAHLEAQMRRSERLATMSVMAAGLAHEIKNPLAIITNRIELMQRDVADRWPDASLGRDLDVLNQHVARLGGVTADLLHFAKDEGEGARNVSLHAIATRAAGLLERTYVARGLRLDVTVPPDLPWITANESALETVLVNLLINAADATARGGTVTLVVRHDREAEHLEVEVRDTGAGIPAELRERIFEPFFTTKAAGQGTGLGLSVCRSILDRYGGAIRADGAPGGGSRFIVTLPLELMGATWQKLAS